VLLQGGVAQQQNVIEIWDATSFIASLRASFQPPFQSWMLKIMVPSLHLADVNFTPPGQPEMGGNVTVDGLGAWGRALLDLDMKDGLLRELDLGTAHLTLQNLMITNM
jgi:hypothetical protein